MKTHKNRRLRSERADLDAAAQLRRGFETAGVVLDVKKEGMSLRDDAWPLHENVRLSTPVGCSHLPGAAAGSFDPQRNVVLESHSRRQLLSHAETVQSIGSLNPGPGIRRQVANERLRSPQ
jgi:hypothetical protein